MIWTDEQIELLKTLHAAGLSASVIALRIGGITRNAVCGKIDRLGLQHSGRQGRPARVKKPREPRRSLNSILNERAKPRVAEPLPPHKFLGIPFIDLEPQHCRYPQGESPSILYCGQPKMEGSSYCPSCHARCYWKPQRASEVRVFIPQRRVA